MNELELQLPTIEHKVVAEDFKNEFFKNQETIINGSALFDQMNYEQWLKHNTNNRKEKTVNSNWVPATTFFAVRKNNLRIVGMIDIRHNLKNDFLAHYGGHIGFSVRPSERKKGYGVEILQMGIEYARSLGIKKLMLGCFSDNLPSIRTILKCGGKLTETKKYSDRQLLKVSDAEEKIVNIYWINL
jgi:predicted acetyltransferase